QRAADLLQQVLQELHAVQASQGFAANHRVDFVGRRHGSRDRQMIALGPVVQHRRQTLGTVAAHHGRQQIEARFIGKNQGAALLAGARLQLRPALLSPAFNRLLVPLDRARDRNLRRPSQVAKHPGDMVLVIVDAQFLLQDLGHTRARPELPLEVIRLRPMPQKIGNQRLWRGRQLGLPAMRMRHQSRRAAGSKVGQPLADRLFGDPQGLGDIPVHPAQLRQLHGPKPPPLAPIVKAGRFHPAIVPLKKLKRAAQLSVSIRAIQAGETILATSLTRKALDGSPDSPELKGQYANLSVNGEGRASIDGKGSCPEKLSEAIILLNQVLEIANAKDEIGWLRYPRAEANDLVGRDNEAETDYRAALETNLQEPVFVRRFALFLEKRGRTDAAIDVLKSNAQNCIDPSNRLILGSFLGERRRPDDLVDGISLLEESLSAASGTDPNLRAGLVITLVQLLGLAGQYEKSIQVIDHLPPNYVSKPVLFA